MVSRLFRFPLQVWILSLSWRSPFQLLQLCTILGCWKDSLLHVATTFTQHRSICIFWSISTADDLGFRQSGEVLSLVWPKENGSDGSQTFDIKVPQFQHFFASKTKNSKCKPRTPPSFLTVFGVWSLNLLKLIFHPAMLLRMLLCFSKF